MIGLFLLLGLQAQAAAPKPAAVPAAAPAGWTYKESAEGVAPRSASVSVTSTDGNARLVFRCDGGGTADATVSVQYLPKPPAAPGNPRTVQVMLDHSFADNAPWYFPCKGAMNFYEPEVFLLSQEVDKAKEIGINFADDAGNGTGNDFAGPGGDALFRKVYAVCGIPYEMPSPDAALKKK